MGYAFISYSTKNQAPADSMRAMLSGRGIETWMAPYDIPIGSRYAQVINQAVKDCACFVLLLTDAAQNSVWVAKEVERAINYKRVIIPIQLEDIQLNDEFELYISSNQIVAVRKIDDGEPMMKRIVDTIEYHCGKSKSAAGKTSEASSMDTAKKKSAKKIKSDTAKANGTVKKAAVSKTAKKAEPEDEEYTIEYHGITDDEIGEIFDCSNQLLDALESFKISAKLIGVEKGPRVTRYVIVPAKGISVNKIARLEDDIALALAAESVRIEAPIPGKSAVGIEVPNKNPSVVRLSELTESQSFTDEKSGTAVCLGKGVCGNSVFADIASMPHLLIAGATGMGKSVCINSLIASVITKATPDEVKFMMIDPKKVELINYSTLPYLLCPVITDVPTAVRALEWAVSEMNRRYDLITSLSVRNIDAYNQKVSENPALGRALPRIVIFIDELTDLMIMARDPVESLITMIAQKARSAGIHLVIGTQRPSVDVITGVIKANIPSRISFKVASAVDSRTILDRTGAERLLGKGDMLYIDGRSINPIRLQGAFISEKETDQLVKTAVDLYGEPSYNTDCVNFLSSEDDVAKAEFSPEESGTVQFDSKDFDLMMLARDETFIKAVRTVIESGNASISFLQRKLYIGFSKAAHYIDTMEKHGMVSSRTDSSKMRKVLITRDDFERLIKKYY